MGTAVVVIQSIQAENWYADLYGALSLAYRLAALIKSKAAVIRLARHVRDLDDILNRFFKDMHAVMKKGAPKDTDTSPERLAEAVQGLQKLHSMLNRFHQAFKLARLTNNSLLAAHLDSINKHNENLVELLELLELSAQPDVIDSIYNRAHREKSRGEIFDLSEV